MTVRHFETFHVPDSRGAWLAMGGGTEMVALLVTFVCQDKQVLGCPHVILAQCLLYILFYWLACSFNSYVLLLSENQLEFAFAFLDNSFHGFIKL